MEERLAQLEQAVSALQVENEQLKQDLSDLRSRFQALIGDQATEEEAHAETTRRGRIKSWLRKRWPLVALALGIAVPILALTVWHLDTFWSTFFAFLNGFLLYYVGPKAWALLIEGLFRAIPGVIFGQATRIAVDKYRARRTRSGS